MRELEPGAVGFAEALCCTCQRAASEIATSFRPSSISSTGEFTANAVDVESGTVTIHHVEIGPIADEMCDQFRSVSQSRVVSARDSNVALEGRVAAGCVCLALGTLDFTGTGHRAQHVTFAGRTRGNRRTGSGTFSGTSDRFSSPETSTHAIEIPPLSSWKWPLVGYACRHGIIGTI